MKRIVLVLALAAMTAGTAEAASVSGNAAMMLASLVGQRAPLPLWQKSLLAKYLNGWATAPHPHGLVITISAPVVTCRASNVDITTHGCHLEFNGASSDFHNRAAHELFATLNEAGVTPDGAAGSVFESVANLHCIVNTDQVEERAGGGAQCTFVAN